MAIHGKSRTVGKQGLFYGVDGTLPYWIFDSQDSPSNDPVLIWIINGKSVTDIEAVALAVGPLCVTPGSVLADNKDAINSKANVVLLAHPNGLNVAKSSIGDVLTSASEVTRFISLFTEKYPQYSYAQGIQLGAESFAARHIPIFAANLMTVADRPVNVTSVILGNALIDPMKQYRSYFSANCVDAPLLGPSTCSMLNESVTTLIPELEKCQVNPALPFCQNLVSTLQQNELGPIISEVKNVYGFNLNASGQTQLDIIEAFQNNEQSGKVFASSMFDLYRNPADLLSLSSDELIQPYQYIVQYLLGAGVRVLAYSGENDMVYNPTGIYDWTSALTWSKQKISVTDGVLYSEDEALGTGFVKGGLVYVTVPDSGHLVSVDNNKVFGQMISAWCKNIPFRTLVDIPDKSNSTLEKTTAQTTPKGTVLDVSVGIGIKATLDPIIITITSTVTEMPGNAVSTVFETLFQTKTLNSKVAEHASTAGALMPQAMFTTTDTVFVIQPTTTTESFFRTLRPSTVTVTETTTVGQAFRGPGVTPSFDGSPVFAPTAEATLFTIATVPVASLDISSFYDSSTAFEQTAMTEPLISARPNSVASDIFLSMGEPVSTLLHPPAPATGESLPVTTTFLSTVSVFYPGGGPIPITRPTLAPAESIRTTAALATGPINSEASTEYPEDAPYSMNGPASIFPTPGPLPASSELTDLPLQEPVTTIYTTDIKISTIRNTGMYPATLNSAVRSEGPTGVYISSDDFLTISSSAGYPEGTQEAGYPDSEETNDSAPPAPEETGEAAPAPAETDEAAQPDSDDREPDFGEIHPAPAPISQPTSLIGSDLEGHETVPDDVFNEPANLDTNPEELDSEAPGFELPRPDHDESHSSHEHSEDNIFHHNGEYTYSGFDDDGWNDWHDDGDDENNDEEDEDRDDHNRAPLLDHISGHIDYAVNRLENGLDIASDSFEQGIDSTVDGVEDAMDRIENGLDRAMNSFKRFGRIN